MQNDSGIAFLKWCLGGDSGYVAIGSKHYRNNAWKLAIFPYDSSDTSSISEHISRQGRTANIYFCPTVLRAPRSIKENITRSSVVWADLDECSPDKLLVPPTVVVETSPNRYQAYWKLQAPETAIDAEEINHRIARYHIDDGCDQGGWDLTQQLRIPGTNNYKYLDSYTSSIIVKIVDKDFDRKYALSDFDVYPSTNLRRQIPKPESKGKSAKDIIYSPEVQTRLHGSAYRLFENEPNGTSWSEDLFKLELLLFSAGLSDEEVFIVCKEAACNKYARDNRPDDHLWQDVCRAKAKKENRSLTPSVYEDTDLAFVPSRPLLSEEEHKLAAQRVTFIEQYVDWAKEATDAPVQYHEAGAFMILSGILAGAVRIPTSAGTFRTNLWVMTLGKTTLSRKSTSMGLAVSLLEEVDEDCVLATDGSVEGILDALATRPNRSSMYHKDEFSGLLEAMSKRDYLAGAMEHFTQLYDSQRLKRVLRTGTVKIDNPIFILYAGGIKDRICSSLSVDHIASGFVPRFIFISPDVDLTNQRPIGPKLPQNMKRREELVTRLQGIKQHYAPVEPSLDEDGSITFKIDWNATITPDSWALYNRIENTMQTIALESDVSDLMMPMMDRLAKSGLKLATLIAASERLDHTITVHPIDILHAFHYIENYMAYSFEVVSNAGKSGSEKLFERIASYIQVNPGISRAKLMTRFHLTSRDAEGIFNTLQERGLIFRIKNSTGVAFMPQSFAISMNGNSSISEEVDFSG